MAAVIEAAPQREKRQFGGGLGFERGNNQNNSFPSTIVLMRIKTFKLQLQKDDDLEGLIKDLADSIKDSTVDSIKDSAADSIKDLEADLIKDSVDLMAEASAEDSEVANFSDNFNCFFLFNFPRLYKTLKI